MMTTSKRPAARRDRGRCASAQTLSRERERVLLTQAKRGDVKALAELVLSHDRMARSLARRYATPMVPAEDLRQEALAGFVEGVATFDLRRQVRFSVHARHWGRKRVLLTIQEQSSLIRLPEHIWRRRQLDRWSRPVVGYPDSLTSDRRFTAMEAR